MAAALLIILLIVLPWVLRLASIKFAVPGFKDGLPRREYVTGYYFLCTICTGLIIFNVFDTPSQEVGCYRTQGIEVNIGRDEVSVWDTDRKKELIRARIENVERVRGWLLKLDKKVVVQIGERSVSLVNVDSIFIRQTWFDGTFLVAYDGDRTVVFPKAKCARAQGFAPA